MLMHTRFRSLGWDKYLLHYHLIKPVTWAFVVHSDVWSLRRPCIDCALLQLFRPIVLLNLCPKWSKNVLFRTLCIVVDSIEVNDVRVGILAYLFVPLFHLCLWTLVPLMPVYEVVSFTVLSYMLVYTCSVYVCIQLFYMRLYTHVLYSIYVYTYVSHMPI